MLVTFAGIIYLFRRDAQHSPHITRASWVPLLWFLVLTTRTVSQWCETFNISLPGGGDVESGTPADAIVFFALIAAGVYVLHQRRVQLAEFSRNNRLLWFFLIYCLMACVWSDSPFVALKRWVKILGHPIMVLVLLTEPDPVDAIYVMLKRTSYIVLPISIVFIKYFPQYGVGYDGWTGTAHEIGITTDKNAMGAACMLLGYFWFCYTLKTWQLPKSTYRKQELYLCLAFLGMTAWVMHKAQSSTSLVSMAVGMAFVVFAGLRLVNPYRLGMYLIVFAVGAGVLEEVFGIHEMFLAMLGKDPTLTDRTKVWQDLLQMPINPIIGTGFESFWLGDRLQYMWSKWWWHPVQAHNGYIETYLNLGLIGLFFMVALIIDAFRRGQRAVQDQFEMARFRMGYTVAFLCYNWTEAAFKAMHPVWFVFFLVAIDLPRTELAPATEVIPDENEPISEDIHGEGAVGN